jgi:hypothetical protein
MPLMIERVTHVVRPRLALLALVASLALAACTPMTAVTCRPHFPLPAAAGISSSLGRSSGPQRRGGIKARVVREVVRRTLGRRGAR